MTSTALPTPDNDPWSWLEEVEGTQALDWVRERSGQAEAALTSQEVFEPIRAGVQDALEAEDRIAMVTQSGEYLYNFWTDSEHQRGLWRRTTWESYRTDDPQWEVLLDLDALSEADGVAWVWHGASVLRPERDRALVSLSPGGSDADVTREFDLSTKSWVPDGFRREESKGGLGWIDRDTVFAFTDVGEGSMTRSGYPRTVRRWSRGTTLADAPEIYAGTSDDMYIFAMHDFDPPYSRSVVGRSIAFYKSQVMLLEDGADDSADGSASSPATTLIEVPESSEPSLHRQWLAVELRHDWQLETETYLAGSLLVIELDAFLAGDRDFSVLFTPDERTALAGWTWTKNHVAVTSLQDVRHRVHVHTPGDSGWSSVELDTSGDGFQTVSVSPVDPRESDDLWLTTTGWLTPLTLSVVRLGDDPAAASVEVLKSAPERFDASGLQVTQHWVDSADGTPVPYFQIAPRDLELDGSNATVLYGYGGFEIALTPNYDPIIGRSWLAAPDGSRGVYVVAGIRGGGEFGPRWHQSALRENRHRAYEDFVAVARDLTSRGVTSVPRLACRGGSNGGLLVGNMLTGYPDDFGAIVCQVPLLDMYRYPHLLAGASWMAEYGDPDDASDWEFIETFSPYHRFDPSDEHPAVFIATSTKDDRVHPGHARKMAELLREHDRDVTYWENIEGGHGGASTPRQTATLQALAWTFLHRELHRP